MIVVSFIVGLHMVIIGHYFRIGAMFTAEKSFHHLVQYEKAKTHKLITTGVYAWVRHPSYFGWMIWAVGTQFVLYNPISIILFFIAGVLFFRNRIPFEEFKLSQFFGQEYEDYAFKTPIYIPFVNSYLPYGAVRVSKENKEKKETKKE